MLKSKQRLLELNAKLAETLSNKGVTASSDETTTSLINKVSDIEGIATPLVEFSQVRPEVQSFLDNVTYDSTDYTTSEIADYVSATSNNQPLGFAVNLKSAGTLIVYDSANGGSTITNSVKGKNYIFNLTPNTVCHYVNIVDGAIDQSGTLKSTGQIRMIKAESAFNVRDLGGWACDGGTVKYGKLFRGGQCYAADADIFYNMLKIRHELNLRYADEITSYTSPIGNGVEFTHIDGAWYTLANKSGIKAMMDCVIDCALKDKPLYFHCASGADRTGTLALIILAVLGVAQSDIDKDYELTCFKTGVATDTSARRRNESEWKGLVNAVNAYSGDTFRNKIVNYLVGAGISISKINAFRHIMIDGTPEDLGAEQATVTNNLTNATSSNSAVSIDKSNSYTATITADDGYTLDGATVTVTMGGTDITSSVYANGVISIDKVTDDIVITITAKKIVENLFVKDEVVLNKRHSGTGVVDGNGRFMSNYIPCASGDILNIYCVTRIDYAQGSSFPKSQKIAYYDSNKVLLGTRYLYISGADSTAVTTVVDSNNTTVKIGYHGSDIVETYASAIAYSIIEIQINGTSTALTSDDVLDLVISKN